MPDTSATELLKHTSAQAHELKKNIHRNTNMIPWEEIEPLLKIVLPHFPNENAVFITGGYASPNVTEWRTSGQVPLRIKWILKGLISEFGGDAKPKPPKTFSFSELTRLFAAFSMYANSDLPENKALILKLAKELSLSLEA